MAAGSADVDRAHRLRWASIISGVLVVALALATRYESWEWRGAGGHLLGSRNGVRFVGWSPPPADLSQPAVVEVEIRRYAWLGLYRVRYVGPPPALLPG